MDLRKRTYRTRKSYERREDGSEETHGRTVAMSLSYHCTSNLGAALGYVSRTLIGISNSHLGIQTIVENLTEQVDISTIDCLDIILTSGGRSCIIKAGL